MKKHLWATVMFIAVFGCTSIIQAHAETLAAGGSGGGGGTSGSGTGLGTQDQIRDQTQDPTTHTGTEPDQTRTQDRTTLFGQATSSPVPVVNEETQNQGQTQNQFRLQIDPEHIQLQASSSAQLGQLIQNRERELEQGATSSSSGERETIQNTNQVRVAVFALLSAQNMLGSGIGPQVSAIAKEIDNSLQSTANAEIQIQERGLWTRIFFGGDKQAGTTLNQIMNENQARIQNLALLLQQAGATPEVQAQLQAQVQTLQNEQERLQQIANREINQWGLFSWRF